MPPLNKLKEVKTTMKKLLFFLLLATVVITFGAYAAEQYGSSSSTSDQNKTSNMNMNGMEHATVSARVENQDNKEGMATIAVNVKGTTLTGDTAGMHGSHLHDQIDNGPIVVTNATNLSFAHLSPGKHTIKITAVDMNHRPISNTETVDIDIKR